MMDDRISKWIDCVEKLQNLNYNSSFANNNFDDFYIPSPSEIQKYIEDLYAPCLERRDFLLYKLNQINIEWQGVLSPPNPFLLKPDSSVKRQLLFVPEPQISFFELNLETIDTAITMIVIENELIDCIENFNKKIRDIYAVQSDRHTSISQLNNLLYSMYNDYSFILNHLKIKILWIDKIVSWMHDNHKNPEISINKLKRKIEKEIYEKIEKQLEEEYSTLSREENDAYYNIEHLIDINFFKIIVPEDKYKKRSRLYGYSLGESFDINIISESVNWTPYLTGLALSAIKQAIIDNYKIVIFESFNYLEKILHGSNIKVLNTSKPSHQEEANLYLDKLSEIISPENAKFLFIFAFCEPHWLQSQKNRINYLSSYSKTGDLSILFIHSQENQIYAKPVISVNLNPDSIVLQQDNLSISAKYINYDIGKLQSDIIELFPAMERDDNIINLHDVITSYAKRYNYNSSEFLSIPIGNTINKDIIDVKLGYGSNVHMYICGATRSGKGGFINTIATALSALYSPEEVSLIMCDCNPGAMQFKNFVRLGVPNMALIMERTPQPLVISLLEEIKGEIDKRSKLFEKYTDENDLIPENYTAYRKIRNTPSLPRIVILIDEFHRLYQGSYRNLMDEHIEDLLRISGKYGIHIIACSQSNLSRLPFVSDTMPEHFAIQLYCRMNEDGFPRIVYDSDKFRKELLSLKSADTSTQTPGEAIIILNGSVSNYYKITGFRYTWPSIASIVPKSETPVRYISTDPLASAYQDNNNFQSQEGQLIVLNLGESLSYPLPLRPYLLKGSSNNIFLNYTNDQFMTALIGFQIIINEMKVNHPVVHVILDVATLPDTDLQDIMNISHAFSDSSVIFYANENNPLLNFLQNFENNLPPQDALIILAGTGSQGLEKNDLRKLMRSPRMRTTLRVIVPHEMSFFDDLWRDIRWDIILNYVSSSYPSESLPGGGVPINNCISFTQRNVQGVKYLKPYLTF